MTRTNAKRAPRPAGAFFPPSGLLRQQRDRERALQRLRKLRQKASDEIERLIRFLDESDPYAATELEAAVDDEPIDGDELEPGFCGVTAGAGARSVIPARPDTDELEADYGGREADEEPDADDEPSLGSHEFREAGAVSYEPSTYPGCGVDVEAQCEDEGAVA